MAISYPRTLPTVGIKQSRFGLNINQGVFEGGLSRKIKVQNFNSGLTDRWEGYFTTTVLNQTQIREMAAWLTSLNGIEKTFYIYDFDHTSPAGSISGSPLVDGASQTGKSINVKALALSTTGLLLPGDYIQIGLGYHMVLEQVDSDGTGRATINFEPALRTSPADNAAVIYNNPKLVARLAAVYDGWETDLNKNGIIALAWEEDLG